MRTKWFMLLLAAFAVLILSSCGSNGGSNGSDVTDPDSVETVGIVNCSKCHNLTSPEAQNWLASTHGNPNISPAGPHDETSSCQPCHNQLLDGENLPAAYLGEEARSIVSCESCHGGGSAHRGIGPLPFPRSGWEICGPCHDNKHGLTVGSDFTAENPHLKSLNDHVYTDDAETAVSARCSKCHSDEGAWRYRLISGDYDQLVEAFDGVADLTGATAIECRTCHKPHAEETTLLSADEVFTGSDAYNTCTNCHQLTYSTADGGDWMQDAYHAPPVNQFGDYEDIISDTHYDDPATNTDNTNVVEGYVVRADQHTACSDCHNKHNNDNTINNQWAKSGHGGFIAEIKTAAEEAGNDVFAAGVDKSSAPAWTYYNWDNRLAYGSCQRCHTATGGGEYLDDPDNYDPDNNDFSHLSGWTAASGSPQNELLYCWGCHSDTEQGELRNPGAITLPYDTPVTMPDLGDSNSCVGCHGAWDNGASYAGYTGDPNTPDTRGINVATNPLASHYLIAAATLYAVDTKVGYEYAGLSYAPVSFFAHDGIGLVGDSPETGDGSCVACHMQTDEPHTFQVVGKDTAGVITEIKSQELCDSCHTTFPMSPAILTSETTGYQQALDIIIADLDAIGITFDGATFPYFSGSLGTTWIDEGTHGAAHNLLNLFKEPGGYAHNRFYVKRLLFDSIDWMDNGVINQTITIDTAAYPDAAHWFGADETTGEANRP